MLFLSHAPNRVLAFFIFLSLLVTSNSIRAQSSCIDSAFYSPTPICPTVVIPVCGCDGNYYNNSCEALGAGVSQWSYGVCPASSACDALSVDYEWYPILYSTTVSFFQQSTMSNGQISAWFWEFGDGGTSDEQHPNHNYPSPGDYTACLTVTAKDDNGNTCVKTKCQVVRIPENCKADCYYAVDLELDGLQMQASLSPTLLDTPFFFYVQWSLDGGDVTGDELSFQHLISEPGIHTICATYPTGDFSPETCTVCKAFEVTTLCVDPAQIDSVACPLAFIPVCGCDGQTYNNSCEAYYWGGVAAWTAGPCGSVCNDLFVDFEGINTGGSLTVYTFFDQSHIPGGQITEWYWDFGNGQQSTLQYPTLNFNDPGDYEVCLTVVATTVNGQVCSHRVCKTVHVDDQLCYNPNVIDTNTTCLAIYDPVCGCDGQTYENDCVAYYYYGITDWTPGICPADCINPAWIDPMMDCIEIYDPVCGCDDQTYDNACYAIKNGVSAWQKGICCDEQTCHAAFTVQVQSNTILIQDLSTNAAAWALDFGDGTLINGAIDSMFHTYANPGTYIICLEIQDSSGTCSDAICVAVNISSTHTISPTAPFTCTIQPNPAADLLQIKTQGAILKAAVLLDVLGKPVLRRSLTGTSATLSVQELPSGIYFLQIISEQGSISRKIAVQH